MRFSSVAYKICNLRPSIALKLPVSYKVYTIGRGTFLASIKIRGMDTLVGPMWQQRRSMSDRDSIIFCVRCWSSFLWVGLSTRVQCCVRFRVRFKCKSQRHTILFQTPIATENMIFFEEIITHQIGHHPGQEIVHRFA